MSVEERAADIRTRLRNDMAKTLRESGWQYEHHEDFAIMLDALMEDALHRIEPLLIEADELTKHALEMQRAMESMSIELAGWRGGAGRTHPGMEVARD